MQAILDEARGNFDSNASVKEMLQVAHSASKRYVSLVEEGWHQPESLYGKKWLHITLFYAGVKYHCYTPVSSNSDIPKPGSHRIESISYISFTANRSRVIEVMRS